MKERPILFSAPMVRALLNGKKTQTRRKVKGLPIILNRETDSLEVDVANIENGRFAQLCPCPYGKPGDRLWVREAFMHEPADYCWEASVSIPCRPAVTTYRADYPNSQPGEGWKPSIHMPRALSRITLEITGVRVERLQDISEADALAEGIERPENMSAEEMKALDIWDGAERACFNALNQPVHQYRRLWNSINGPDAWDANPWVWAVEFRRLP